MALGSSADSPYAFSTFHHLKRFREGRQKIAEVIELICLKENINPQDLRMRSRRRRNFKVRVRAQIVYQLVEILGILQAEAGRQKGVSTFAISEALDRKMKDQFNSVNNVPQFPKLIVPVDTHMHKICRLLGLTKRKHADMGTATEITKAFRSIAPADPVRYDFSLTRLGIRKDADMAAFLKQFSGF